ncbi:hypothetical protein EV383_1621 [Pseudonocardia sediminis]|uniref:Uncharacterized protein n=1 Tax=Pseudonocardia sediminis TaxID=1397368 RepID=A0A4Q7USW8_PSEST|nr:hypothetical protein [Pseudonocardia sediminis]RZT84766.1 hypothetical protein EV383_1621 [Pseudonocardia sediminis]
MTVGNQPSPLGRPAVARGTRQAAPRPPALRSPGRAPRPSRGRYLTLAVMVAVVLLAGVGYAGYRQAVGDPEAGRRVSSAAYTLTVPDGWTPAPPGAAPVTVYGIPFVPVAQASDYPCRDGSFTRGTVAGAQVAVPTGVSVEQAAGAFARGAGEALYAGAAPQVAVGPPTPRDGGGTQVEATVRTDGFGGCRATEATVLVVAEPRVTAADGSTGAALLVIGGDTRGGPAGPEPLTRDVLIGIASTAEAAGS